MLAFHPHVLLQSKMLLCKAWCHRYDTALRLSSLCNLSRGRFVSLAGCCSYRYANCAAATSNCCPRARGVPLLFSRNVLSLSFYVSEVCILYAVQPPADAGRVQAARAAAEAQALVEAAAKVWAPVSGWNHVFLAVIVAHSLCRLRLNAQRHTGWRRRFQPLKPLRRCVRVCLCVCMFMGVCTCKREPV
jgi:hypothetical protein